MAEHPSCRSDPGAFEEKPTFEKGDRVRLHANGRKGVIKMVWQEHDDVWYDVHFDDKPRCHWLLQAVVEKQFAKAVSVE